MIRYTFPLACALLLAAFVVCSPVSHPDGTKDMTQSHVSRVHVRRDSKNSTLEASRSCGTPPIGSIKILWDYDEQPQLNTRIKGYYLYPNHVCVTIRDGRKKLIKRIDSKELYEGRVITERIVKPPKYSGTLQFRMLNRPIETIQLKLDGSWNIMYAGVALEFDQVVGASDSSDNDDGDDNNDYNGGWGDITPA